MPTSNKAAFLQSIAPLFPNMGSTAAHLQALEARFPDDADWHPGHAKPWLQRYFVAAETLYLPIWSALAPVYAAALAQSVGPDHAPLAVQVEHWPATLAGQQQALHRLLHTSRLRQAWRAYMQCFGAAQPDPAAKERAQQLARESSAPLREVPLHLSSIRASCQQLVCLPVDQWQALHTQSADADADKATTQVYRPHTVHTPTVDRLAQRVAQVFNAPPCVDVALLQETPGWQEPVIWDTDAGTLTNPNSCHGMRDRWEHGWQGEVVPLPSDAVHPEWRYEGFYGQLRVTLEDGTPWLVTVLAPLHFVRHLANSAQWYDQPTDATPEAVPLNRILWP
ncbi:MAG TPA: hypothetical protein PK347_03515 [Burkholderiaceae bacterium]|nr:hypothetical protein [Burkholderiaceae bacterium]